MTSPVSAKLDSAYFISYEKPEPGKSEGWFIISRSASKRKEIARASTLPGALAWVRDRQEKPR